MVVSIDSDKRKTREFDKSISCGSMGLDGAGSGWGQVAGTCV